MDKIEKMCLVLIIFLTNAIFAIDIDINSFYVWYGVVMKILLLILLCMSIYLFFIKEIKEEELKKR